MKTVQILLLAVVMSISSFATANNEDSKIKKETPTITKEIGHLLKKPNFEVSSDLVASVTIAINKKNEMVVLSVDSSNSSLEQYIKSRLNYQKVSAKLNKAGKTVVVPIRITSES